MNLKESRKKVQRTIVAIAGHDRMDLALKELHLIKETLDDQIEQIECVIQHQIVEEEDHVQA